MVPARIVLSLALFSEPNRHNYVLLFLELLNYCVLLAALLECLSTCDEFSVKEFLAWYKNSFHLNGFGWDTTSSGWPTNAHPSTNQMKKQLTGNGASTTVLTQPILENEEEHTMRNCSFRNNFWWDYAFLSVHLGLSHWLQWSTRRLTLDTCLWWLPLGTHQMWKYLFATLVPLLNVHNTKLCVSCMWSRIGQTTRYSTPVSGGRGVYSTPCKRGRWRWGSWQRTSRRWSVRTPFNKDMTMRWNDALAAGPPGKRSSMRKCRNSFCTTTCGTKFCRHKNLSHDEHM